MKKVTNETVDIAGIAVKIALGAIGIMALWIGVMKIAEDAKKLLANRIKDGILGPAPAVISKLRGSWRYNILIKGENLDKLRQAVCESLDKLVVPVEVKMAIDVEPVGML